MFLLAWCGDPGDLHCRENNDPRRALRGFLLPRQGTEYGIQKENVTLFDGTMLLVRLLHLSYEFEQQSGNAPSSVLLLNIMIYVSAVSLYCTARAPRARFTPAEQGPRGPPKVGSGTLPPALPGKATENFSIFGSFFRTGVGIE